jgi:hypothetical protein
LGMTKVAGFVARLKPCPDPRLATRELFFSVTFHRKLKA